MQPLRRDVAVDAARGIGEREPGLGAEERLVLDAELVDARDGDLRLSVRVAVADHDRPNDVRARVVAEAVARRRPAFVDRLQLGRPLEIDDRLEWLGGALDPARGPPGLFQGAPRGRPRGARATADPAGKAR